MVREKQGWWGVGGGGENLLYGVDKPSLRGFWFPFSR